MHKNALSTAGLMLGLALALPVQAYDPVPDPRMSGGPEAPGPSAGAGTIYRSGSYRDKDNGSNDALSSRSTKRGEPGFGNAHEHVRGDGGYGGGYNRGGR